MTEFQVGKVHFRSYTNPSQWKLFFLHRSKSSGRYDEKLIGWYPKLEMACNRALEYTIAESDVDTIQELIDLLTSYKEEVMSEIRK